MSRGEGLVPSYDYFCKTCDALMTMVIGIKEELITPTCISCKTNMVRSFGVQAIQFKGKGWASKEK
jgi:putative FmdB family regulatory protein